VQGEGEQFVTVENSMGVVTQSRGHLPPASEHLKSEVRLIAEIADALFGGRRGIKWRNLADDYFLIRDEIAAVIPGFEEFNDRLIEEGHFELPHPVRDELSFNNVSGKALFTVHPIDSPVVPQGCYLMMTIRSHDQFNTTIYSQKDRYRGITDSRRVIFMNRADIQEAGLQQGSRVAITSHHGDATRTMQDFEVVPYQIPLGCVATYYPETNPLIPVQHVADGSNTPAYKSVVVSLVAEGSHP
jgi:anaerobic selenocysteine-containing dehydrogenase